MWIWIHPEHAVSRSREHERKYSEETIDHLEAALPGALPEKEESEVEPIPNVSLSWRSVRSPSLLMPGWTRCSRPTT
jgi:hypothetical protein